MRNREEKREHGRLFCRYRDRADIGAFERLLKEYEGPLYSYLLRFLRNPADAEDALQDVWLKAIRRADSYDERGQFSSWLYRIAHNHSLDILRRQGRMVGLNEDTERSEPSHWSERFAEQLKSPFEVVEQRELLGYLDGATATMSPAIREVFVLRMSAELSFREISEILECPLGTVLGRMHQAVLRIRKRFEEMGLIPAGENNAATTA